MLLTAALLFTGCDLLEEAREELTDLTNPLVGQVMIVGIAEPDDPTVAQALEGTDWEQGIFAQVFLADATSANDLSNAPVGSATVKAKVGANGAIRLIEDTEGSYLATHQDGLVYQVNANVEVSVNLEGGPALLRNKLPSEPDVAIPSQQAKGAKMIVDLEGTDYNAVLGVVVNAQTQAIVWSNEPTTAEEIYDFTHNDEAIRKLEIPGASFANPGVYAVGIAGLVNGDADQFENVNSLLSGFMAGKMSLYPVTVLPN